MGDAGVLSSGVPDPASPASPSSLDQARTLLQQVHNQLGAAVTVVAASPLEALDALKRVEERVGRARKLLAAAVLGETPKGARRVLLHTRTRQPGTLPE